MTLTLEAQVEVTSRVVNLGGILAVGRLGNTPEACKLIRSTSGGSLQDGRWYWADGPGAWVSDSPAGAMRDRKPDLTWAAMVRITLAGLSPGALAGGAWAYRQYLDLHDLANSWDCPRCAGSVLRCGHRLGSLAQRLWFQPGYSRGCRLMAELLAEMVGRYRAEADRVGVVDRDRIFRIHWDGDFFSVDYARAWAQVIRVNSGVNFWAYTRSFVEPVDVVPVLAGIDNLALYLSADEWNAAAALQKAQSTKHKVLIAWCAVDYDAGRQLAGDRPSLVCPENNGRIPLMANGRGACVECQLCPLAKRDVIFSTSHSDNANLVPLVQPVRPPGQCANPACKRQVPSRHGAGDLPWCRPQCRWSVYRRTLELSAP